MVHFLDDYLNKKSASWVFGATLIFNIAMLILASLIAQGNLLFSDLDYHIIASVLLYFSAIIPFVFFMNIWQKNAVIFMWFLFVGTGNILIGMYLMYLTLLSGLSIDAARFYLSEMNHSTFSMVVSIVVPLIIILLTCCFVHLKMKQDNEIE
ncbi:hypothetical protein [Culicoidibacter larvae]|uniref:Uncharacterized protein n=1 Tax=Culicoidibacter larvae TaxID=2579976 RepID=A0A5R8QDA0_9FIRM|nr:hypothetical protein [Culicoidibacter larvae]TLG74314.1 hypothetical protein FEZ08_06300 [Culicoidibacter larvae]